SDCTAGILRSVTVIREDTNARSAFLVPRSSFRSFALLADDLGELMQLCELILRERLRRKQIQRARRRVRENALQDRRVVAERLARRRRRDDDDVAAGESVRDRCGLMRVELVDPARSQRVRQTFIKRVGKRREYGLLCGKPSNGRDVWIVVAE